MGETDLGVFYLTGAGLALKLLIHLVHHPQSRGTDGMTKTLQATIRLAGYLPIEVIKARVDVLFSPSSG